MFLEYSTPGDDLILGKNLVFSFGNKKVETYHTKCDVSIFL